MILILIYGAIAVGATFLGSITGMGGGVLIKPIMDAIGDFDAVSIGLLSSVTVFAMAVMSCVRQRETVKEVNKSSLILLGVGSAVGGITGQMLFDLIKSNADNNQIKVVQNSILAVIIFVIFFYMIFADRLPKFQLQLWLWYLLVGLFLGIISSFLGIGGGPINVAILMFLFSMEIKQASFASIVTILFSQFSKLLTIFITEASSGGWFSQYNVSVMPAMVIAGLIGAFLGSMLKKKLSNKAVSISFNIMQVLVFAICIFNIFTAVGQM